MAITSIDKLEGKGEKSKKKAEPVPEPEPVLDDHTTATLKDACASMVGSTACVYTGQPFDTLKVQMQVQTGPRESALTIIRRSISEEGVLSLWKGSVPACMGAVAENCMAFGTNGLLRRLLAPITNQDVPEGEIRILGPLLTGAMTGCFTAIVLAPCDILKCRAQVAMAKGHKLLTTREQATAIYRKNGLRGFYTGFCAQLMREIPFYSAFFGSYEILCQSFRKYTSLSDGTIFFVSGGLAGQTAWTMSIAADSIKSVIQTSANPKSIRETARDIYVKKGLRGFYAGLGVAVVRAFPANAALFVGYEYTKKLLG